MLGTTILGNPHEHLKKLWSGEYMCALVIGGVQEKNLELFLRRLFENNRIPNDHNIYIQ